MHQGQRFERTHRGPKTYAGLDGPVRVVRDVYRGRETGQALCPFETRVGMVEARLTPAAARLLAMSAACQDSRMAARLHEAAHVLPRSKSAMQRDVQALGHHLGAHLPALEARRREALAPVEGVHSLSVSVDRTGLPFEEPRPRGPGRPAKGAPRRPCEVVHRQVYCATLTLHDAAGEALATQRFAALPGQGEALVERARACLGTLVAQHPGARLVQICDGAKEMQRRGAQILEGHAVEARLIDAWHAASYVSQAFGAAGYGAAACREMVRRLVENSHGRGPSADPAAYARARAPV